MGLAAVAAQAGHLLAYQLRFGPAAQTMQSSGAHSYFPVLAKTGMGIAAAALISALLMIAVARIAVGRGIEAESAPSYLRLVAGLFTLQLVAYSAQETLEAQLGGTPSGSASDLLLWGAIGQLPVAAVAALALRWLFATLRPALGALAIRLAPAELAMDVLAIRIPVGVRAWPFLPSQAIAAMPLSRRGPPALAR